LIHSAELHHIADWFNTCSQIGSRLGGTAHKVSIEQF
jgi:hypothetical protein